MFVVIKLIIKSVREHGDRACMRRGRENLRTLKLYTGYITVYGS